jgi:hypothetical protein
MDWTVFAKDGHMTITLRLITNHGRATPLIWKTVSVDGLKGNKNKHVSSLLEKLRTIVPESTQVILLADREFGTLNQMKHIKEALKFDYILRVKIKTNPFIIYARTPGLTASKKITKYLD